MPQEGISELIIHQQCNGKVKAFHYCVLLKFQALVDCVEAKLQLRPKHTAHTSAATCSGIHS